MSNPAVVSDFKAQFDRDFPFGVGFDTVRDTDIQKALNEANLVFNADLFGVQAETILAFCYCAAFFLVENLKAAGGLTALPGKGGQGQVATSAWVEQSKSVGDVSVAFAIPQWVLEDRVLGQFAENPYGKKYLTLLAPRLTGPGFVVPGWNDVNATVA